MWAGEVRMTNNIEWTDGRGIKRNQCPEHRAMVRGICDVGGRCWVSNCVAVTRLSSLLQTWVRLLGARYTQSATKSFRDVVVVRSSPPTLRLPTVCTQWICSTSPSPSHDNRKCKLLPMLSGDSNGGILWYTIKTQDATVAYHDKHFSGPSLL